MHSRIFELKTDKSAENNLTENTVTESDMISCSMDYVTDQSPEDEIESIEWFKQTYPDSVAIDLSEKSFRITDPKKFMQASFRQFKEAIKKLDEATIDDFIGPYLNKDMSKSIGFNLPYFALNMTVLFADGAHDEIIKAHISVPPRPKALYIKNITAGSINSFISAASKILFLLKRDERFVFARNVPKTIIASGVCIASI